MRQPDHFIVEERAEAAYYRKTLQRLKVPLGVRNSRAFYEGILSFYATNGRMYDNEGRLRVHIAYEEGTPDYSDFMKGWGLMNQAVNPSEDPKFLKPVEAV